MATKPSQESRALAALASCESGMTEQVLMMTAGVDRPTLSELVTAGKIRTRLVTMAQPAGMTVTWYYKAGDIKSDTWAGSNTFGRRTTRR